MLTRSLSIAAWASYVIVNLGRLAAFGLFCSMLLTFHWEDALISLAILCFLDLIKWWGIDRLEERSLWRSMKWLTRSVFMALVILLLRVLFVYVGATSLLADWRWWAMMVLLGLVAYVQAVGFHVERVSGIERLTNLDTYHLLFRGLPWVPFRYGGILQIVGLGAIPFLFGWRAAFVSWISFVTLCLALFSVARGHAVTMLEQVAESDRAKALG
jgi:hypothetical protein